MILFPERALVLASTNREKFLEIQEILSDLKIKITLASDYHLPEIEETGTTFEENALLKARACVNHTGLASLADDSGIEIEALSGAPGLFSARFAQSHGGFPETFRYLETLPEIRENPKARMTCLLALAFPSGEIFSFGGSIEGTLVFPPREGRLFGYDPIFRPVGQKKTFSQMDSRVKSRISHRGQALSKLKSFLEENIDSGTRPCP